MARSVDLLIASEGPVEAIVEAVAEIDGVRVASGQEETWTVHDGDVRAVLAAHSERGANEPALGRYEYEVSAEVEDSVRPQDSPQAALLRKIAHKLRHDRCVTVLLVLDLQYRAAAGQAEFTA